MSYIQLTDRLDIGVHPVAVQWLRNANAHGYYNKYSNICKLRKNSVLVFSKKTEQTGCTHACVPVFMCTYYKDLAPVIMEADKVLSLGLRA